jgi:hypothetical protein
VNGCDPASAGKTGEVLPPLLPLPYGVVLGAISSLGGAAFACIIAVQASIIRVRAAIIDDMPPCGRENG